MTANNKWDDFSERSSHRNKALVVENRKFWISPNALAEFSPVFTAMFYSDFQEKDKLEIPLPDKKSDDILEMLRCLVPSAGILKRVDKSNVAVLIQLADEYQIDYLKFQGEKLLHGIKGDLNICTVFLNAVMASSTWVVRRMLPSFARLYKADILSTLDMLPTEVQNAVLYQIIGQMNDYRVERIDGIRRGFGSFRIIDMSYMFNREEISSTQSADHGSEERMAVFICATCKKETILDICNLHWYQGQGQGGYCFCIYPLAATELEKVGL